MATRQFVGVGVLVALLGACGGGDTTTQPSATPAAVAAVGQTSGAGTPGLSAPFAPTIRVTDASGAPVANLTVAVFIADQSGTVSVPAPVTDRSGLATVGTWTLGPKRGSQTLTMVVNGFAPVQFSVDARGYDLTIRYVGAPPTTEVQAVIESARQRIERIVLGDVPSQPLNNVNAEPCVNGAGVLNETVDDIVVFVTVVAIDGAFGVTGEAGPCGFRLDRPFYPYAGMMRFDVADVTRMLGDGSFLGVATHELLHALGFGSSWNVNALLQGFGGVNPLFTGAEARARYAAAGGTVTEGVPVANVGGPGTRDAHWRESTFATELMTPTYQLSVANPLSAISIGSLADLGYVVSYATADAYTVPGTGAIVAPVVAPQLRSVPQEMLAASLSSTRSNERGFDRVVGPTLFVDRAGRSRR